MAEREPIAGQARQGERADRTVLTYYSSKEQLAKLDEAARREGLSRSYVIRKAIDSYLGPGEGDAG